MCALETTFIPTVQVQFASSNEEFLEAMEKNARKNGPLKNIGGSQMMGSFENIIIGSCGSEYQYFYIHEPDEEVSSVLMIEHSAESQITWLYNLETRPDYRGRGYAPSLLCKALEVTEKLKNTLRLTEFTKDGWEHISRKLPILHQQFPNLGIEYENILNGCNVNQQVVDGKKPYIIENGKRFFERTVRFI